MADKYAKYHNVEDFIERKMRALIKQYSEANRYDIAGVLEDALNNYLHGEHDIVFVNGWPHVVKETFKSNKS